MLLPKSALLVLLCFCSTLAALAQQSISGKITDAVNGNAIPGVTVRVPNSNRGTISDVNGSYTLTVPVGTPSLVFSFTGYKTTTVPISGNTVNVKLQEDFARLDEVIITGLATSVKRSNLANAVATISSKQLSGVAPPQTFDAAISGKVPGAMITASSGAPGGGISVRMRGVTSIFSNTQPLYVVDGIFFNNSSVPAALNDVTGASNAGNPINQDNPSSRIADLNPQDIESIEILKGASAAALYGAKAAAGVIIITTKKGKSGQTRVSLNQETGFMKIQRYMGIREFTADRAASLSSDPARSAELRNMFTAAQAAGKIYNYEKELYGQTGLILNTSISASGGNDRTTFYLSAGRRKEEGIIKNTGYLNNNVRLNVDHRFSDRVSLNVTTNYINSSSDRGITNNDNNGVSYGVALSTTPSFAELHKLPNGEFPANGFSSSNPLETSDKMINNEGTNRFVGGGNLEIRVQEGEKSNTKVIVRGGVDYYTLKTSAIFPRSLQFMNILKGASIQGNTSNINTNLSAFVVNTFTPSSKLNFTTSAGATLETGNLDNVVVIATNLIGTQTNVNQAGAVTTQQFRQRYRDNGIFVQEEITLLDAITATGGVRFDRSTNNGDFKKYYVYPKAALSWNIAKMDFWNVSAVNNLKVRFAYGQSGNVPPSVARFTMLRASNIGGYPGSFIDNTRGKDNILPERQKEMEAGLDVSILDGRVSLEATYYNKQINDLLMLGTPRPSSGYSVAWENAGDLRNRGVELGLHVIAVNKPNIRWNADLSWWKNRSKFTRLTIPPFPIGGFSNSLGTFYVEEGAPATQIYGTVDGKFQQLGNSEPDFQMSWFNEITFLRDFAFRFLIHWKKGGDNINLSQFLSDAGGTTKGFDDDNDKSGVPDGQERANLKWGARQFVADASYLRIREIGIYYNLPLKNAKFVKGIRLGLAANNWFTWTDYIGYDPEVSNFGSNTMTTTTARGTNGLTTGVDVMPFPSSKRMSFHLGIDF